MRVFLTTIIALFALIIAPFAQAKSFGAKVCKNSSKYVCYTVKKGDNWNKLFPDKAERDVVMKINRMNTGVRQGSTIAIPTAYRADLMAHSPMPDNIDPLGKKTIIVSKSLLAFGAYNANGKLERWGPISAGRSYCADLGRGCGTPVGKYTVYRKGSSACKSSKYPLGKGGAPMPYCMFYHRGYAMHGSPTVPGYHASRGCVRMFTSDAKWISQEFDSGERSLSVIVKN